MKHKNLWITTLISAAILTSAAGCSDHNSAQSEAKDHAEKQYEIAKEKCEISYSGNAKDVCIAEAKANEKRAKAEADAAIKNTPEARIDARIAAADGNYDVAKQRCEDKAGNEKDVCLAQAKAAHTQAVAEAKANREALDASQKAHEETAEARYKVAVEKCDALAGKEKDDCVARAKQTHNQNY